MCTGDSNKEYHFGKLSSLGSYEVVQALENLTSSGSLYAFWKCASFSHSGLGLLCPEIQKDAVSELITQVPIITEATST